MPKNIKLDDLPVVDITKYLQERVLIDSFKDHIELLRKELHRAYLPVLQNEFGFPIARDCLHYALDIPIDKWNYQHSLNAFRECCEIAKNNRKEAE